MIDWSVFLWLPLLRPLCVVAEGVTVSGPTNPSNNYLGAMAKLHDVVFDCSHPASLARFWAEALDGYEVAPYDDEELERLRREGIEDPEDDPSVLVQPVSGAAPRLFFNKVPERKKTKNRVHLDLWAEDVEAEVERLTRMGASRKARVQDWVAMADPEGNEFDILPAE